MIYFKFGSNEIHMTRGRVVQRHSRITFLSSGPSYFTFEHGLLCQ